MKVIKSSLNPIWNESLMLWIPDSVPLLKLQVYDKDTFTTDNWMGEAEINIEPLVAAAKAYEASTVTETVQLNKWMAIGERWHLDPEGQCLLHHERQGEACGHSVAVYAQTGLSRILQ